MARKLSLSPATAALAVAGLSQIDVANALGESQQDVSDQLAGKAAPNPALIPVVRALAGPDAAEAIARLITSSRAAQGFPTTITDPAVLARVAQLVAGDS